MLSKTCNSHRTHNNFYCRRYEDEGDNSWGCASWFEYLVIVILSPILLVGALALTLVWVFRYRDGVAWSEKPEQQFYLHPILMVGGFITLSGFCKFQNVDNPSILSTEIDRNVPYVTAILLYRLCRCLKHIYVKLAHTFFHACTIPCVVIGFLAVYDSHNLANPPIENFYTIHSWIGLVTMGLFALQFVFGFFT